MRGVRTQVRHHAGCPKKGAPDAETKKPEGCKCSPSVRARIEHDGQWETLEPLPLKWKVKDYDARVATAVQMRNEGKTVIAKREMPTLAQWAEGWLEMIDARVLDGAYSERTAASYRSLWLRQLEPRLGRYRLNELDDRKLNKARRDMEASGLSPGYAKQTMTVLGAMLDDAIPRWIESNPAKHSRRNRRSGYQPPVMPVPQQAKVLTPDDARTLLAVTDGLLRDMVEVSITTGLRVNELRGLRWECLDFAAGQVLVRTQLLRRNGEEVDVPPKMGKPRETVLWAPIGERLIARRERAELLSPYVFTYDDGRVIPYDTLRRRLNKALESIGRRPETHSWHMLRHTFSSLMDGHGVRATAVDYWMGHHRPEVRHRYQHILPTDWRKGQDVLDALFVAHDPAELLARA